MRIILLCLAFLLSLPAHAEKITVFDQKCVATEIRACLDAFVGRSYGVCPEGTLPLFPQVCADVATYGKSYQYNRDLGTSGRLEDMVKAFTWCEKTVNYSVAPGKCSHTLDIPSADQLEQFNKNFNDYFIKALEKAHPSKAAESSALPTPAPIPMPAKP